MGKTFRRMLANTPAGLDVLSLLMSVLRLFSWGIQPDVTCCWRPNTGCGILSFRIHRPIVLISNGQ